jgi:hypothetical protein
VATPPANATPRSWRSPQNIRTAVHIRPGAVAKSAKPMPMTTELPMLPPIASAAIPAPKARSPAAHHSTGTISRY